MSENRVWVQIDDFAGAVLGLAVLIVAVICTVTWYNLSELNVKREALARGASPLEVQCIFAHRENQAACLVILGGKK